ncbi:MAG TPA: hypothetical protein VGP94_07615 [Tepidisphaeraceae bacterium]|nr:hypothetical protein [Tepidisphaeraceae bacterium]
MALVLAPTAGAAELVVHEWGTFTSFQDETGLAFTGINAEDEPLPDFCHKIRWSGVIGSIGAPESKAASRGHPDITMRLETPVIYFHPPKDMKLPFAVDVDVQFRGGWLTQFYPDAKVGAEGLRVERGAFRIGWLADGMTGSLSWPDLQVGVEREGPATPSHVWTAPRKVAGASVMGANGEAERFVFYRGVARLDAPIRVVRNEGGMQLALHSQLSSQVGRELRVEKLWLADFREGDVCAYRRVDPMTLVSQKELRPFAKPEGQGVVIDATFRTNEYGPVKKLREEMKAALIEDGLFVDEAEALLNTWELSYFKSGGMRLFFMVPLAWTDHYLPLKISVPSEMVRTMVGRIEIVTPQQRELLARMAESDDAAEQMRCYRALGRFKEVLLARQLSGGSPKLGKFVRDNKINLWGGRE